MEDPIVNEIRAARETIVRKNGFDHRRIFEDLVRTERMRKSYGFS